MPRFQDHCEKSKLITGEEGREYHRWLDQYSKYSWRHREVLHNKEGIEIGVQLFGEIAREHLQQHIMDDWELEKSADIPTIRHLRENGRTSYPTGMKMKARVNKYQQRVNKKGNIQAVITQESPNYLQKVNKKSKKAD